jgi:hypothetical protein
VQTDYKKLLEGCPLLEQYKEDEDAFGGHANAQQRIRRPQYDAWLNRYHALAEKMRRSEEVVQRFALEAQPELNDIFSKGEAARLNAERKLSSPVEKEVDEGAAIWKENRESIFAAGDAPREALNNLDKACKTSGM